MKAFMMIAAVATSALLLVPTVAPAQTVATANVSAAGLDLSSTADRAQLHARLTRAINQLCAEPGTRGLNRMAMERACVASAKSTVAVPHFASNRHAHSPRG
jgi:UrcA family protein